MALRAPPITVVEDDPVAADGLEALVHEAWAESGRFGGMPAGWRPFGGVRPVGLAARCEGRLEGFAAVRPSEGMDTVEFLYVRKRARAGGRAQAALIEAAVARLRAVGLTRIIYAGYGWWRREFPGDLAEGFARAGFGRFEGIFLIRPIWPGEAPEAPLPPGYSVVDWDDRRFAEVCDVMLRSPEPGALYWDTGLCRRSILNAANPVPPLFRDGFGKLVLREGRVKAFALATSSGYVNHVYTDPAEQGRGLARAVLARLLGALGQKGLAQASILTHETNPRALRIYEALGFRVEFRFPQFHLSW